MHIAQLCQLTMRPQLSFQLICLKVENKGDHSKLCKYYCITIPYYYHTLYQIITHSQIAW